MKPPGITVNKETLMFPKFGMHIIKNLVFFKMLF